MSDDRHALVHALNNPLLYVTLGLELIEREVERLQAGTPSAEDWERLRALLRDALQGAERVRAIVRDTARKAAEQPEREAPRAEAPRRRILLVDDERHLGMTLSSGLRDAAEVVSVTSGREAVQLLLQDDAFDLVLCDLAIPDLPGRAVFEEVVAQRPRLETRFVFVSGGPVSDVEQEFLDERPAQRLDKPFRLEQVEELLRR